MKKALTLVVFLMVGFGPRSAAAQAGTAWTDRGYVNLNVGFESVSGTLNDSQTFGIYGETASLAVSQAIDSGSFADFSAGARVWKNFSVGIGFHQGSTHSEASGTGTVPSPIVFNQDRRIAFSATELTRSERAVHLQLGYMLPINDRLSVHVLLGPSFFKLRQDVVSAVTITEAGGTFTQVNAAATVAERSDSSTGINVGVDVAFKLYEANALKLGAGMFVRYSGASANVTILQNTVDSDVGGLQVGFGGRVRF